MSEPALSPGAEAWGDLDLAPIGNCSVSALIDRQGRYVWACTPRVDGDPVFSALLGGTDPSAEPALGVWSVDLDGFDRAEQSYLRNTAVLRTVLHAADGAAVELLDFCPRHRRSGRTYRPLAFARLIRPLSGAPRVRIRLRPAADWGARPAERTAGSNHLRYLATGATLRLTTNAPIGHLADERVFRLEEPLALFLGPDEPFVGDVLETVTGMAAQTGAYWRDWVRTLAVPLDYQAAVIRAAITLKLCVHEETGAIVAALTTSVPEFPGSGRNWDYRYCWLRDAYYVVQALNRLGAADILEGYLGYLRNIIDSAPDGRLQPLYGVGYESALHERIEPGLPGFRGMGPVRVGNQAHEHLQYDVYGQVVLSNVQAFFDERLFRPATIDDFQALEAIGERAFALHDQPDAGLWEFRTIARVHTYSSVMCWAACDRLENAALKLGLGDRAAVWRERAEVVRARIEQDAWVESEGRFAASFDGTELDASLLQMLELRFLPPDDPRFRATFEAVERDLRRGPYLMRYVQPDDFGEPETAFNFCTFWLIETLHLVGRTEEARALYEGMLSRRTHAGLLSEDMGIEDGRLWGNYPQTYSLVGLINCAVLLSRPWSSVR
ncbi:MAG: glycoside hydrolase family 15 protein [Pseudomonadota bacterium]|nr:glycoside hydrolase family 15 protein [Pseudomonadota bacterium]